MAVNGAVLDISSPSDSISDICDVEAKLLESSKPPDLNALGKSSSVDSIISFQNDDSIGPAEFNVADVRDLQICVDNPQKHTTGLETFITFRLTTKTSRAEFDQMEYVVRRRYNDFAWLRARFVEAFPTHIIPPLPEKHTLREQIDRYDQNFVKARMVLLNRFLNRFADHPILSYDPTFHAFLTAKQAEFSVLRKSGPGILMRVSESFNSLAATYMVKERTLEFEKLHDYVCKLGTKLSAMDKISGRIHKERQEYWQVLQQLQPALSLWGAIEPDLNPAIGSVSQAIHQTAGAARTVLDNHKEKLALPLKEYVLYVDAVKDAMNRRDAAQIEYELTMEDLCKVKQEQEKLESDSLTEQGFTFGLNMWKSPEELVADKKLSLVKSEKNLRQQVETNRDKMEYANENLRADAERWNRIKKEELKAILLAMADEQIEFYSKSLEAWRNALPAIKNGPVKENQN